jgi:hypothetical protein
VADITGTLVALNETIKALRTDMRDQVTRADLREKRAESIQRDTLLVLKDLRTLIEALQLDRTLPARIAVLEAQAASGG